MKKILFLSFIFLFNSYAVFANGNIDTKTKYSAKFDIFLSEFLHRGGSNETAIILKQTFIKAYNSEKVPDFNKFKLKLITVFLGLKSQDQKILWQMYTNKKEKINKQIKIYTSSNT